MNTRPRNLLLVVTLSAATLTGCLDSNPPESSRRSHDPYRSEPPREDYRGDRRGPVRDELEGWALLGSREVDFRNDQDTIQVGRSRGRFRALKFVVRGGDIELYDLVIQVGEDFIRPNLRHRYSENTASPTIDLPGDERTVGRVDFYYKSTDRRDGRATVSLYGR